jgi:salicylate hydroxylase
MEKTEILIAGGGIAGLAAAIAVAPRDTLLLEQAAEWQEVGAGLQLGPNAVRALQKLGAWDAVAPFTSSPPAILIRDGVSGSLLKRLALGKDFERRFGAPYRVARRSDLHRALREVAESKPHFQTRLAHPVSSMGESQEAVEVMSGGHVFSGKALLAADGVNSAIRQHLFPDSPAQSTNETLHRALLPQDSCENINDGESVNLWFYPGGHIVHYPAGHRGTLNLVAVTPLHSNPNDFFSKSCDALKDILARPNHWTTWPALYVEPLRQTFHNRTLLLGDAAHGTVPYLAQGAAMALEDAAEIHDHWQQAGLQSNMLEMVSARRKCRTTRIHQASMKQRQTYHATGVNRRILNLALRCAPTAELMRRVAYIYE